MWVRIGKFLGNLGVQIPVSQPVVTVRIEGLGGSCGGTKKLKSDNLTVSSIHWLPCLDCTPDNSDRQVDNQTRIFHKLLHQQNWHKCINLKLT